MSEWFWFIFLIKDEVIGVLDMDSPVKNGFSETDKKFCEEIVKILENSTNFEKIKTFYDLK